MKLEKISKKKQIVHEPFTRANYLLIDALLLTVKSISIEGACNREVDAQGAPWSNYCPKSKHSSAV